MAKTTRRGFLGLLGLGAAATVTKPVSRFGEDTLASETERIEQENRRILHTNKTVEIKEAPEQDVLWLDECLMLKCSGTIPIGSGCSLQGGDTYLEHSRP